MTQREANESIIREEWRMIDLIRTTAELFFEKIPVWLFIGVLVALPVMMITSFVSTLLPSVDMNAINKAITAGDAQALLAIDLKPLIYSMILTLVSSLILFVTLQAVVIYTDRWLQGKEKELTALQSLGYAVKRWPALMFTMLFIILSIVGVTMLAAMIPLLMTILLLAALILGVLLTYYGCVVTTLRKKMGLTALTRAWQITSKRFGRNLGALALLLLIQSLITSLLNMATSAMVFTDDQIVLYVVLSGVVGIISTLPSAFVAIGVTLNYINAEQMYNKRAMEAQKASMNQEFTMHGPRPVRPIGVPEEPDPEKQNPATSDPSPNPSQNSSDEPYTPESKDSGSAE